MDALYDRIGTTYSTTRCTDPVIARQLYAKLEGASRVLNVGAGAGSYEPESLSLIALEPSQTMIAQRKPDAHPVVQATAEAMPFANDSFSHVMTVLSMHHWRDRVQAYKEINRVATVGFVAITYDPNADPFWLTRDYFPEIHQMDAQIFPPIDELQAHFDSVEVQPLWIPAQCEDGFLAAFWKRPHAYLDPEVRQSISAFAKLDDLQDGLNRLGEDLKTGRWAKHNAPILEHNQLDVGYRLICAGIKNTGGL